MTRNRKGSAMHPQSARIAYVFAFVLSLFGMSAAQDLALPNKPENARFAIIGDSGTGSASQFALSGDLR